MIKHSAGIVAAIAFIILCTLLPFLPGRYDSLAVPLSSMALVVGTLGLILIPFGLLWLVAQRSKRLAQKRHVFSLVALSASSFVWMCLSLVAAVQSGFAFGVMLAVFWIYVVRKAWPSLRRGGAERTSALPLYLVIVPAVVALLQLVLVDRAIEFSRTRAIRNSAPLIAEIEQHRRTHGRYPTSLLSVHPDLWPDVIGIKKYEYELHGDSYNLFFEQFTYRLGTREFVMYNPRDEHVMTSHALDLLQLTPDQLALDRTRGHNARHDLPEAHWKYFWFD